MNTPTFSPRVLDKKKSPGELREGSGTLPASLGSSSEPRGKPRTRQGLTLSCPLGGTHLGLHEEDGFHPGLWPTLVCSPLELSHMVSLAWPSLYPAPEVVWWRCVCQ